MAHHLSGLNPLLKPADLRLCQVLSPPCRTHPSPGSSWGWIKSGLKEPKSELSHVTLLYPSSSVCPLPQEKVQHHPAIRGRCKSTWKTLFPPHLLHNASHTALPTPPSASADIKPVLWPTAEHLSLVLPGLDVRNSPRSPRRALLGWSGAAKLPAQSWGLPCPIPDPHED